MRTTLTLCLLCFCVLHSGCNIAEYSARNLYIEIKLRATEFSDCRTNRRLARAAWNQFRKANPSLSYSASYAEGFQDGYADYLNAGGSGQPPALPPRHYWTWTCEGRARGPQAAIDWFDGFRDGADAARASGQRELLLPPIWTGGLCPCPPPSPSELLGRE
jgi:hypothetical protein